METIVPREFVTKLQEALIAEGKIIEGGFAGLMVAAFPQGVGEVQRTEMRKAFFAGANHLFATIISMLDPGQEPTDADMGKMDLIHKELQNFQKELLQGMT